MIDQHHPAEHEKHGRAIGVHARARVAEGEEEGKLNRGDSPHDHQSQTRDRQHGQRNGTGLGAVHEFIDLRSSNTSQGHDDGADGDEQIAADHEPRPRDGQDRIHDVQVSALVLCEEDARQEGHRQNAHDDGRRRPVHDEVRRGEHCHNDREGAQRGGVGGQFHAQQGRGGVHGMHGAHISAPGLGPPRRRDWIEGGGCRIASRESWRRRPRRWMGPRSGRRARTRRCPRP